MARQAYCCFLLFNNYFHMHKTIIIALTVIFAVGLFALPLSADAYVSVRGYYRSNGTYVSPYVRSNPNALKYDNYGYTSGSLFNRSYYAPTKSYSSSWYTPSYLTDTSYYSGLSLYRSKSSYSWYGSTSLFGY